jgi:hypothetical protein
MPLDQETSQAKNEAQLAILKAIAKTAEEIQNHTPQTAAEGLRNLAEAYAWTLFPNQPH